MGAYLNKPITEKHSESGGTDKIKFAATSMQGWRVNQEDAHNCIMDLENGWHLFAVYDGHGGPEVAKYTSLNFPKFVKDRDLCKAEDIVQLLQNTFVDFDDHLRSEPVMLELKKIANGVEGDVAASDDDEDDGDEDKAALFEEGTVPLEQLLKKYGYELKSNGGTTRVMRHITDVANEHLAEARALKKDDGDSEDGEGSSSTSHKRPNESPRLQRAKRAKSEVDAKVDGESKEEKNGAAKSEEEKTEKENADGDKTTVTEVKKGKNTVMLNSAKVKGALDDVDVNSSDDEDYKEGEEAAEDDEEDEDEEESDDDEADEDEEEEEEEEDEDMGDDSPFGGLSGASFGPSGETPGEDSGTTACVCIVAPGKVIVANAGDSRAIICRSGKAIDLSIDHKPEDQIELNRITKAGGCVNEDGRVNGGLNLSRAFGDHCYKKNKALPLREQMISALPDVKIHETSEEDDFIVVACDGIWNSLESQQVVDFVKERLDKNMPLTKICEEMCTECLADSTSGDGTGCDNMTIIIADLKPETRAKVEAAPEAVQV